MRVLVVEDQSLIGKALQKGLQEESFAVDWATNVADGLHLATELEYDTIVLDLMLPDGTGLDLLEDLRKRDTQTPVLILTAKDTLQDKARGFRLGTDDYMTKPFAFEELLLRVQALSRRKYRHHGTVLEAQGLRLDLSARSARNGDEPIHLTAKEFAVLEILMLRRGHVLSREKIGDSTYAESSEAGSNVIDVLINKLRRKLEAAGQGGLIETIRGEGYVIR